MQATTCIFSEHFSPVPAELLEERGYACPTPAAVAEASDIIIVMVPDTPQVEEVIFGEQGLEKGLAADKVIIDMSSISPIATKQFAEKIEQKGASVP